MPVLMRRWVIVSLVVAAVAGNAVRSDADKLMYEEPSHGIGGVNFEADGVPAAIPADARSQLTWFIGLGPEGRPVRVLRASVTNARLVDLSVVVARQADGSSRVALPVSPPPFEQLLFFLVADGRDCSRFPPGTAELVRPRLSVLYEIGGRRIVREVDYPPTTIMVPRTRPCS